MGRKISRKKKLQSKYKSKKYFQSGGQSTVARGKLDVLHTAAVTSGAQRAESEFSETMKEYDNIRRIIENLKYDGNNLASYNERKTKYRNLKTAGIEWLLKKNKSNKATSLKSEGLRIAKNMGIAINAMQKFSNQSTIGSITQGQKKTEVHRLVMLCRRRGVDAITDQLNKDLTKINSSLNEI